MSRIHILEVDTGNEAHAIRAASEYWGAEVSVTWVGNSTQIVDYLSSKPSHEIIIISGHGNEAGLLLPEIDNAIKQHPYDKRITASQFCDFVDLDRSNLINLSCESGKEDMAKAFLSRGAKTYIGPLDYPDGSASLMYALEILYCCIVKQLSMSDAHEMAINHTDDRSMFRIYD